MRFSIFLFLIGLLFACPPAKKISSLLKIKGIPIEVVEIVEPFKEIPQLCRCVGILKRGNSTFEVEFYTSQDGNYFIPFVGKLVYEPSGIEGIKKLVVVGLKNSNNTFTVGYITNDLKYFFPAIVPLIKKGQKR